MLYSIYGLTGTHQSRKDWSLLIDGFKWREKMSLRKENYRRAFSFEWQKNYSLRRSFVIERKVNLLSLSKHRVETQGIILDDTLDSASSGILNLVSGPGPNWLITCWNSVLRSQYHSCWICDLVLSCVSSFWTYFIDWVGTYLFLQCCIILLHIFWLK